MIKRTVFESEHEMFRDSLRKFLNDEAVPFHSQWEKDGQVDRELWRKAGQHGYLSPTVAEEFGGVGADFRYNAIVDEVVAELGLSGVGLVCTLTLPCHISSVTAQMNRNKNTYLAA